MKEHPFLFNRQMVQAALAGIKTQTRRLITERNSLIDGESARTKKGSTAWAFLDFKQAEVVNGVLLARCKYPETKAGKHWYGRQLRITPIYQPGDLAWGKETWWESTEPPHCMDYDADVNSAITTKALRDSGWVRRPSIFLPKRHSRIWREVVQCGPRQVKDITTAEIRGEGLTKFSPHPFGPLQAWQRLWDSINAERAPYAANPWVWDIKFKRM